MSLRTPRKDVGGRQSSPAADWLVIIGPNRWNSDFDLPIATSRTLTGSGRGKEHGNVGLRNLQWLFRSQHPESLPADSEGDQAARQGPPIRKPRGGSVRHRHFATGLFASKSLVPFAKQQSRC